MNTREIEYFLITAEEMNITRAANRLFISQQALSAHIKRLEAEYGAQLFRRKPTLALTPEGKELVYYGERILSAERHLRASISDISETCRAHLTLGISRLRADAFFPMVWQQYRKQYPHVTIELVDGNSEKLQDLLDAGKLDLYIGPDVTAAPEQEHIHLASEYLFTCMSDDFLRGAFAKDYEAMRHRFQSGLDIKDISYLPLLTMRPSNRLRKRLDRLFAAMDLKPNYVFETDSQPLIYQMAKQGTGIGIVSPVVFYQNMREIHSMGNSFHIFPIKNELSESEIILTYRTDYPRARHIEEFIKAVIDVFQNYQNAF